MSRAAATWRSTAVAVGIVLATMAAPLRAQERCEPFPEDASSIAPPSTTSGGAAEVVLVLPKRADGSLGTAGLELAPGARVASSFFSPVICATIARIVGPPGLPASALVPGLPDDALVVENSAYEGASQVTEEIAQEPTEPPGDARAIPGSGPDPYRPLQYALDWIDVEASRSVTNGGGARIAVLDSLPDATQPDLPGIRVLRPPELRESTVGTHGTMIAGIVAAAEDNGFGIAGVAPGAELLAVPVCRAATDADASDSCDLFDVLLGVDAAFQAEAQVVNLSVVGPPNPVLERAMERLDALGTLVVAAAGNDADDRPRFPAAYPTVIGVGAVDRDDAPFGGNNRGAHVEIMAPGVEILSTTSGASFAFGDGTSLATANVSAVLGLLVSVAPDVAHARQALFEAGHRDPRATRAWAVLPEVCSALERLGRPCSPP